MLKTVRKLLTGFALPGPGISGLRGDPLRSAAQATWAGMFGFDFLRAVPYPWMRCTIIQGGL